MAIEMRIEFGLIQHHPIYTAPWNSRLRLVQSAPASGSNNLVEVQETASLGWWISFNVFICFYAEWFERLELVHILSSSEIQILLQNQKCTLFHHRMFLWEQWQYDINQPHNAFIFAVNWFSSAWADRYKGQWLGSQCHGKGVLTRPDGSSYEGYFQSGTWHVWR